MDNMVCARFIGSLFTFLEIGNITIDHTSYFLAFSCQFLKKSGRNVAYLIAKDYVTERFFKGAAGVVTKPDVILVIIATVALGDICGDTDRRTPKCWFNPHFSSGGNRGKISR